MTPQGGKRAGAGRPKTLGTYSHIGISMSAELKDDLKKAADELGISVSELIRRYIKLNKMPLTDKPRTVTIPTGGKHGRKKDA